MQNDTVGFHDDDYQRLMYISLIQGPLSGRVTLSMCIVKNVLVLGVYVLYY